MEIVKEYQKGYLRASVNIKVLVGKFLKQLTKEPLKVINGNTEITYKDLKRGLDNQVKRHIAKKKEAWKKINILNNNLERSKISNEK